MTHITRPRRSARTVNSRIWESAGTKGLNSCSLMRKKSSSHRGSRVRPAGAFGEIRSWNRRSLTFRRPDCRTGNASGGYTWDRRTPRQAPRTPGTPVCPLPRRNHESYGSRPGRRPLLENEDRSRAEIQPDARRVPRLAQRAGEEGGSDAGGARSRRPRAQGRPGARHRRPQEGPEDAEHHGRRLLRAQTDRAHRAGEEGRLRPGAPALDVLAEPRPARPELRASRRPARRGRGDRAAGGMRTAAAAAALVLLAAGAADAAAPAYGNAFSAVRLDGTRLGEDTNASPLAAIVSVVYD